MFMFSSRWASLKVPRISSTLSRWARSQAGPTWADEAPIRSATAHTAAFSVTLGMPGNADPAGTERRRRQRRGSQVQYVGVLLVDKAEGVLQQ